MNIRDISKERLIEFSHLERKLQETQDKALALNMLKAATESRYPNYYSEILEQYFIGLAQLTKSVSSGFGKKKPLEKTYLHVLSEVSLTGGHTRIVERWINHSDKDEKHSVYLSSQKDPRKIPEELERGVRDSGGKLITELSRLSIEDKANNLREIAMDYDVVILHHNPIDPVPLMAFGVKEFTRPVICFNHSGHKFWVGKYAIDFCIDIEKGQNIITKEVRGIKNTRIINMPIDKMYQDKTALEVENSRKRLGFSASDQIITSMASMYKFNSMGNFSFVNNLRSIMSRNEKVKFIGIGIRDTTDEWRKLVKDFPNRVQLIGNVPFLEVKEYLQSADLYIDSLPIQSWLSFSDAINIGQVPAISLKNPLGYLPYLEGSEAICKSSDELIEKALAILNSRQKSEKIKKELSLCLKERCNQNAFKKEIQDVVSEVKKIKKDDGRFNLNLRNEVEEMAVYWCQSRSMIRSRGIPYLVEIVTTKCFGFKHKTFRLFGINLINWQKEIDA